MEKKTLNNLSETRILILIIITLILFLIPNAYYSESNNIYYFLFSLFNVICFLYIIGVIVLLITKSFYYTYLIIGVPVLISSVLEMPHVVLTGGYTRMGTLRAIIFSTQNEQFEFLRKFYIFLIIPTISIFLFVYILTKIYRLKKKSGIKKGILYLSIFLFVFTNIGMTFTATSKPNMKKNSLFYIFYFKALKQQFICVPPVNIYYNSYLMLRYHFRSERHKKLKASFNFDVQKDSSNSKPNIILFIIGERMRYSNWAINGYSKPTNPLLEKIENLVSFNKNYSNANVTFFSVPLIITQENPNSYSQIFSRKTISSLFKEADFKTYWIANQDIPDFFDVKDEADSFLGLYQENSSSDLPVISAIDNILSKGTKENKFILVNLLGGHTYSGLPSEFIKFSPNSSQTKYPVIPANAEIFINDYNNIIYYQDYVIGKIIELLKKQSMAESLLVFTADHGCNLFDNNESNLFGYGSEKPTEHEIHVPLFIWGSDNYVINNNLKFSILKSNINRFTTNDNLFYTIADLANIKYKTFINSQSMADTSFIEPLNIYEYTIGGSIDTINVETLKIKPEPN
jgi:glucan phosphoethanolaminetransferase (alkaline phosphatase superfamily)